MYMSVVVGCVEERMLCTYRGTKPMILMRYFDDYIDISISSAKELEDFIQYANDLHP